AGSARGRRTPAHSASPRSRSSASPPTSGRRGCRTSTARSTTSRPISSASGQPTGCSGSSTEWGRSRSATISTSPSTGPRPSEPGKPGSIAPSPEQPDPPRTGKEPQMATLTTTTVTSKDGTKIAVDVLGSGPAIVLVSGGSVDRGSNAGLAEVLKGDFTVHNYDRRGRGDSGDTLPYAVEREIEDIEAVIAAAGGSAHLYGSSSGAGLALEAAAAGASVERLILWEPPYNLDPAGRPPADSVEQLDRMVADGRRGDAATFFMVDMVRMPAEFAAFARTQPWWPAQEAIAHTLAYDARV